MTHIKWYQVFVFSMLPLALAFLGVITGSHHGVDSAKEYFPTPAPAPASSSSGGGGGAAAPAGSTLLQLTAQNTTFSTRSLRAAPGAPITIRLTNQDAGLQHNISVYKKKGDSQPLATGSKSELVMGPGSTQITFTPPGGGTFYYQCDVHPDVMNGSLIVQ